MEKRRAENLLTTMLDLERRVVGIKFCKSKEEYDSIEALEVKKSIQYCTAVKCGTDGKEIKIDRITSGCTGSTRALGLTTPPQNFYDGREGCFLGLFEDQEIAAEVAAQLQLIPDENYGVIIKPLSAYEIDPDIVLIVGNTKAAMRIIQGYTFEFGMQPHFNMTGNQAVCVECTSYPYLTNAINLSMFCAGTRFNASWGDYETMIGIVYEKLERTIRGIRKTINTIELNDEKEKISERLRELGEEVEDIRPDEAYYIKMLVERRKARGQSI